MSRLDPDTETILTRIRNAGIPSSASLSPEGARALFSEYEDVLAPGEGVPSPPLESVRNVEIQGPSGGIPVRIYTPDAEKPPILVYYHGGGWVVGNLDARDSFCRILAHDAECIVVSVDYRLAPEHPFPAGLEDAYRAARWAAEQGDAIGGDADRLGVIGDSAGGNLAAATTLLAGQRGGPDIQHQSLICPPLDTALETESFEEFGSGYFLTRERMAWFWEQYLERDVDRESPYAAPLKARTLRGSPRTTVVTCGFDPLRDDGRRYVRRLRGDDVPVTHLEYERLDHGAIVFLEQIERARDLVDDVVEEMTDAFER